MGKRRPNKADSANQIDFSLLFASAPGLYLVLLPDLTIASASDSYLAATMTSRAAILGRNIFEVFPDNPMDHGADGVSNLRASLHLVLETKIINNMKIQKYDIQRPDGSFEVRYWSPTNKPILNRSGDVDYIIHSVVDVTVQELEKLAGQASARKTELLLHSSMESLKGILIFSIDREYRILHFNSAFREATAIAYGTSIEIGMSVLESITDARDTEKAVRNFSKALNGEMHVTIEEYGNQNRSYFENRYNPMFNDEAEIIGVTVLTSNITERRKAEQESRRLASIVDSTVDAIISKSLDGIITSWNQGAERLFGYSAGEAIGKDGSFLIAREDHLRESEIITRVSSGEVLEHYETRRLRRNGDSVDVSLSVSPVKDDQGRIIGISKIARDITDQKRAQERIREMNIQLAEARKLADLASQTKSQFLANMSHEIRTPLNAVIGLSHLLLKTELTSKQMDYLRKIESSSESLLRIINDILDFSKVESGKLHLEETNFDLEEVLQQLGNVITYKASAKGLEVAFGIDSQVPTYLIGDAGRLEQILINLCGNAVKFTDQGEIVVNVKMIGGSDDRINLCFSVQDTGIGMDKIQLSKLFQPFTQADDTISRKYGGTGLGLSIIKRLVELMNGSVEVESEPGQGTLFRFNVWLTKQKHQRKMPEPSVDIRKLSVLLVDDNVAARSILHQALTSLSFRVTAVGSGMQAIHYLKNNFHHDPVKLVLIDWKMPEMDGLETARIIRADEQLSGVKIMMMCTSYANEELFQSIDAVGLSGILVKPIRYSQLYDSIIGAVENGSKNRTTNEKPIIEEGGPYNGSLLLVEDNEINQLVAVELLHGFGFKVAVANNGIEALQMLKQSVQESALYDLVLMDLQMPVMGGRAATTEIRKIEQFKTIPIIAMTADAMLSVREECLAIGMNDFISKPINPNTMAETIVKWLRPTRASDSRVVDGKGAALNPLDCIDLKIGLSYLGGNKDLYHDLLMMFSGNYEHFIGEFKSRLGVKEIDEASKMIHTLKGLSGSLGMVRLHDLCKDLEEVMPGRTDFELSSSIQLLSDELTRVRDSISQMNLQHKSNPRMI